MLADSVLLPVGDLDGWRQTLTQNFDLDAPLGTFVRTYADALGVYPMPWPDSSKHGAYDPDHTLSVANGVLTIHVSTIDGLPRVAAVLPKVTASHHYGRYAVRWRSDILPGFKVAWLLWPDNGKRTEGELDWPEMNLDSDVLTGFVHRRNAVAPQGRAVVDIDATVWHTTIIEWSPELVVYIHDDVEVFRTDVGVPTAGMHWVIQTETELSGFAPDPAVAGDVQVAWLAHWAYDTAARAPAHPHTVTMHTPATAVGRIALAADVGADVSQVKWMVDERQVAWTAKTPFAVTWDSATVPNGTRRIYAKARDPRGWFSARSHTIVVANPIVAIAPAVCTRRVELSVTPYTWIRQAKWFLDGVEVAWIGTGPFTAMWDSRGVADGQHTLVARVADPHGWRNSPPLTITVANPAP